MTKKTLAAAALACILSATPGLADTRQMVDLVCGSGCADTVGTQSSLRSYWDALTSMKTTDFIGSSLGGVKLDASSLLAASSVAGAPELDSWLRTGQASDPSVSAAISSLLRSGSGIDVSSITGSIAGALGGDFGTQLASASGISAIPQVSQLAGFGNSNTASCSGKVDANLVKASQSYVDGVMRSSTDGDYAFSAMGGKPVSKGASGQGMFGGSCIEKFMEGARDILFKPPQLSDLLSRMSSGFDMSKLTGGGGMACGGSNPMEVIKSGLPSGLFASGSGGFFPGMTGESAVSSGLGPNSGISLVSSSSVATDTVGSLF